MTGPDWPLAGGEVGALLRGWQGDECALGRPADWSPTLRTAVQILLHSPVPMTLIWGEAGIQIYNDAYAVIAGARHPSILGRSIFDAWPELIDFHRDVIKLLRSGKPLSYRELPVVLHRNGIAEDVWLDVDYSPVFDQAGSAAGILAVVTERTRSVLTRRARDEAEQALRQREQELAQVQKIGKVGGLEVDLREGFKNRRSPEYLLVHGLPPEAAYETHEEWVRRIHPQERAHVEAHFKQMVAGTATEYEAEYRIIRPSDGALRWISAVAHIERDETGKALRLIGAHRDITERKEAEAQQRLLMQELAHRVKNSMAMIQAIASQTLRSATSLETARETFSARLTALSRAHDLLIGGSDAGAKLMSIVTGVVNVQGAPERFAIEGPDLALKSKAAIALALILHELATNAVKYGALSNEKGSIALTWRIDEIDGEQQFRLRWQERDGPAVTQPTRRGFGSRLIERTFPSVRVRADIAYLPTGIVFTLDAPLDALREDENEEEAR